MSWDQLPNDYHKASRDLAECFLEPGAEFFPVAREGALKEALDQHWAAYLAVLVEPHAEGLRMEAYECCLGAASVTEVASLVLEDVSEDGMPKAVRIVGQGALQEVVLALACWEVAAGLAWDGVV